MANALESASTTRINNFDLRSRCIFAPGCKRHRDGKWKLAALAHLIFDQLLGVFEFLKALKGRQAFRLLSQAPIDLTQDVVVLGRRWIETDRIAQSVRRAVPLAWDWYALAIW